MKKNWDKYFIKIAHTIAEMATCDRKHVGAVVVRNKRILATGFNGSIAGGEDCDNVGHMMQDHHCVRTVHAEINAITQCAKHGTPSDGATMYINTFPCWHCFKVMVNSGIKEIVYDDEYESDLKKVVFVQADLIGIKIRKYE